jgi:hypothetical protein
MELMDMSLPVKSKAAVVNEVEECDLPTFPYGLKLSFEGDQIEKLPSLKMFKVGDKVNVVAEAVVTMIRQSGRQHSSDQCIEMQLEKVNCEPVEMKPAEKMSPNEYRNAREGGIL